VSVNPSDKVEKLGLSTRVNHCVRRAGLKTVGLLMAETRQDLMDLRQFGVGALDEVERALARNGLKLRG
jgi:DNA-directed RNA polymerase subunit alpha